MEKCDTGQVSEREMNSALTPSLRRGVDHAQRWWVLVVVALAGFLVIVASSIANLALPAFRSTLGAGVGEGELAIAAYPLALGALLVAGGRLASRLGLRPPLLLGLLIFTLGSLAAGLAPTSTILIGARLLQGAGAALLFPQLLPIIEDMFEGEEMHLALGLFGSVVGVGLVAGQLIGGALISLDLAGSSWRPIFLALVPIAIAALTGAATALPGTRPARVPRPDWGGAALLSLALLMLALPLLMGNAAGWPAWLTVPLVAAPLAFGFLRQYEQAAVGRDRARLLPPQLFRQRTFALGCLAALMAASATAGFTLFTLLTLQLGLDLSPIDAGLTFLPALLAFLLASLLAPRLASFLRARLLMLGFGLLSAGFLAALATIQAAGPGLSGWQLAPALVLVGLGQGLGMTPLAGAILSSGSVRDSADASGVFSTTIQVGQVLGIAVAGLVFSQALGAQPPGTAQEASYLGAYQASLPLLTLLATLALALVLALPIGNRRNSLLQHVPSRVSGLVYSLYFLTGGRVPEPMLANFITEAVERRSLQTSEGPRPMGDYLVHHFEGAEEDLTWHRHLFEEALELGDGTVPNREERQAFIQRQVEEIRSRQSEGLISTEFDPAALRLMAFALASYPRLLPQVVRMTTGHPPDSPEFREMWDCYLRQLGARLSRRSFEPDGEAESRLPAATPPK
jgi:MFS family permease